MLYRLLRSSGWVLFLLSSFLSFGQQERVEGILDYHSDIVVNTDGSFDVTETIKVYAAGNQIQRGIFRDFPTLYKGDNEEWYRAKMDIKQVLRDGEKEPYHTEGHYDGRRIYIGEEDVILEPGEYTYTIRFVTDRLMRFFDGYDEIYWNVTGNYWAFPIQRSSATIHLPGSTQRYKGTNFCGPAGSTSSCYVAVSANDNRDVISFVNNTPLGPQEGLTIALAIDNGIVQPPSGALLNSLFWYRDHKGILFAFLLLVVLIVGYSFTWFWVGRDPRRGTIIPMYEPPKDMLPAALPYLLEMGYSEKALTASIINLAVKGYITLKEEKSGLWGKQYVIVKVKDPDSGLTDTERSIMNKVLGGSNEIEVKKENYTHFEGARSTLTTFLKTNYKKHFALNTGFVVVGFILSILAILSLFLFSTNDPDMNGLRIGALVAATVGGCILMIILNSILKRSLFEQGISFGVTWGAIIVLLMYAGMMVYRRGSLSETEWLLGPILVLAHLSIQFIYMQLIKAPSSTGRKLMDEVEGFKMFLEIGEGERMKMQHPPELTPALFEKYLPFAIALGVENKWANAFEEALKRMQGAQGAAGTGMAYYPTWYSGTSAFGSDGNGFDFGSFSSSIGSSFGSALGSSTTPPSSSGSGGFGGGGGGFSGGGGGGGGGGGW